MATDIIADPQNQYPRKIRDNGDGSHTPHVYVANPGGGGGGGDVNLVQVGGADVALGQSNKAGSIPVTLASDEDTLSVSATIDTTGLATTATDTNTGAVSTNLGAKADTAASSDTGTFSLIALFKRSLQTLTGMASSLTTLAGVSFATSTKQSDGSQKTQIVNASNAEVGGAIKTNTDPLVTSGGGGYMRQDSTATIAKETGGNLATVKTNTDPLVASGGGGYVRQDSTATIAKETGGNLASVATNTTNIPNVIGTPGSAIPSKGVIIQGSDGTNARDISTDTSGRPNANIAQIGGAAVALGQTTKSGSVPVTLASDQGNVPVNQAQVAGTTTSVNNGTVDAGTQRVTIASDSTGQVKSTNWPTTVDTNVGAAGSSTPRVIHSNNAGKTIVSKGGSASSSGDNTLVSAGTNKLKVFSYTFTTTSTTAMTVKITDGASGTVLWQGLLQAISGGNVGASATVTPPAHLFATSSATALIMNLSSANAVHYSLSYYDEA